MSLLEGMSLSHPCWRSPSLLWSTIATFTLHFARRFWDISLHTPQFHQHRHTYHIITVPWLLFNSVCSCIACSRQQISCLRMTHISHRTAVYNVTASCHVGHVLEQSNVRCYCHHNKTLTRDSQLLGNCTFLGACLYLLSRVSLCNQSRHTAEVPAGHLYPYTQDRLVK